MATLLHSFPHRRNWENSYDSICPRCYRTIASVRNETELAEKEQEHVCEDWLLDRLHSRKNRVQVQTQ